VNIDFKEQPPPTPGVAIALTLGFYPQTVTDRGVRYDPPDSHLGQPINDRTAAGLATLALKYLENMLAEARAFPPT
jgi:hypothetical protein